MIRRVLTGAGVSAGISLAGRRAGALSDDGALAACAVGTVVIAGASWRGATLLGTFFVTSSALSRLAGGAESTAAKDSRRDACQVLANGGVAALAALAATGSREWPLTALAGALGAATADTWATEIGTTSPQSPRLLFSQRPVAVGTSGGVTTRGLAGAVAGAATIGVLAGMLRPAARWRTMAAVSLGGIGGSLADSLLGELLQERRYCANCDVHTEAKTHVCGARTTHLGGLKGLDNDIVNVVATVVGALTGFAFAGHTPPPSSTGT